MSFSSKQGPLVLKCSSSALWLVASGNKIFDSEGSSGDWSTTLFSVLLGGESKTAGFSIRFISHDFSARAFFTSSEFRGVSCLADCRYENISTTPDSGIFSAGKTNSRVFRG